MVGRRARRRGGAAAPAPARPGAGAAGVVGVEAGYLGDVLGLGAGAEQPPAQPEHARLPARQQWAERLAVAGQDCRDQFGVIVPISVHHVILLP